IVYRVTEEPVNGYGSEDDGENNFTNTLKLLDVPWSKTWDDQDDLYGLRPTPEELKQKLVLSPMPDLNDGEELEFEWISLEGNIWSFKFINLPAEDTLGEEIIYTVSEQPVPGYHAAQADGSNLTNRLAVVNIGGTKVWYDQNNKYLTRPDSIELALFADGIEVDAALVSPKWDKPAGADAWTYRYSGLPRYKVEQGQEVEVTYTVKETPVPDYQADSSDAVAGKLDENRNVSQADFANTLYTVSVRGQKTWVDHSNARGRRPAQLGLTLYADGREVTLKAGQALSLAWDKPGDVWAFEYSGLPRYKAVNGRAVPIVYTVKETLINRYRPAIMDAVGGWVDPVTGNVTGISFTNTYDPDYRVPQTGDLIWIPLSLMALSGIAFIILWKRKEKRGA
ncbi:MAG: Cna B-type domain-containing protein, partial [Clostridiales bacterium]|nr:Cna B-type domain-containing protein [Clostridiales bacterium]